MARPGRNGSGNHGKPADMERYAYVSNTPLNSVDALGLWRAWMEARMSSSSGQTSFGTTYYVNGMRVSANVALSLLGMGAATQCPGMSAAGSEMEDPT